MAGSLNKVQLIGNLGQDPEVRHTQDGRKVASFSVATTESWRDKLTNERKDRTEWHRVAIFNEKLCDVVERYLKKGSKIYLEGQLQTRKWSDQNGQERYTTEIVLQQYRGELTMLDNRKDGSDEHFSDSYTSSSSTGMASPSQSSQPQSFSMSGPEAQLDDEIPF